MADNPSASEHEISSDPALERAHALLREALATAEHQRAISQKTGIPIPTLKDYRSGRTAPPIDRFLLIARAAGRDPTPFVTGEVAAPAPAPTVPYVMVPVVDARAAAGIGRIPDQALVKEAVPFARRFLDRLGATASAVSALRATGDSMMPTIADGALMLIDESQRVLPPVRKRGKKTREPVKQDDIYVFFHGDDGMRIKRLRRITVADKECLAVLSDNFAAHPPEILGPDEIGYVKILGKVVWWDNRL